jgi:GNAT superfamily N-acetyltransferase
MADLDRSGGAASKTTHVIGALQDKHLPEASRIFRHAFGTFFGAPDLDCFWGDRDMIYGRHRAPHVASFAATIDGQLVGSNFATNWGSFGFFGPITVRPDLHERGIAQALLARTMEQFEAWRTRHAGLFTFAHSAKHVGLYQKYGFYPRFLTAIMAKKTAAPNDIAECCRFSSLSKSQQEDALKNCREITESIQEGLDLTGEIRTTLAQGLGDIGLVDGAKGLTAFALCHYGAKSEAGADRCFVKFGAVRMGPQAGRDFERLIETCEALAVDVGAPILLAGMNMGRHEAYRALLARGFRTEFQGVAMHRDNEAGYCRPGVYAIDDWR